MEEVIVFRVRQTIYENDYTAFAKKLKSVKTSKLIYLIMSIIMLGNSAIMLYIHKNIEAVLFLVLALIIFILTFIYPSFIGANLFKDYSKLHNSSPISGEVLFGETRVYDNSKNSRMALEYYQFEKIIETKNYFFLMITKSSGLILKKECFINGDPAQFKQFFLAKSHLK